MNQLKEAFTAMPPGRRAMVIVVGVLCVAGFAALFLFSPEPDKRVLFSNLSAEDSAAVLDTVRQRQVDYELAADGSAILVPADAVHELRLALASEGLPKGQGVGFEIFDESSFGTTEFVQKLNYQRALQGELARTIARFTEVKAARVLIVMPKDSVFVEQTRPATASVLLDLYRPLGSDNVSAIVHLVANAVEGLATDQVTVVDTAGKVLYRGQSDLGDGLFSPGRVEARRHLENSMAGHIQSMLERIVGPGKAIVRVSADLNFDSEQIKEEKYDPDSAVVRSRQRRVEAVNDPAAADDPQTTLSDEVTNYEINKVVRHIVRPDMSINRLSAAVVIDGTYDVKTNPDGTTARTYVPRTAEELSQFEAIVKKAMGFDEDREDQVTVSSMPFSMEPQTELVAAEPKTTWMDMAWAAIPWAVAVLIVGILMLFGVRPVLKQSSELIRVRAQEEANKELAGPDEPDLIEASIEAPPPDLKERAIKVANEQVGRTEQLIRGWLMEP